MLDAQPLQKLFYLFNTVCQLEQEVQKVQGATRKDYSAKQK
jgi:hypothetical protein